jgi:hypothetical protein
VVASVWFLVVVAVAIWFLLVSVSCCLQVSKVSS